MEFEFSEETNEEMWDKESLESIQDEFYYHLNSFKEYVEDGDYEDAKLQVEMILELQKYMTKKNPSLAAEFLLKINTLNIAYQVNREVREN